MKTKDLIKILFSFFCMLIFIIFIFFISINFLKLIGFITKIDQIIKLSEKNNNENYTNTDIESIEDNPLNPNQIGFKNDIYDINYTEWGEGINILIVGSDKKTTNDKKARADVIIVLRINKSGQVLSISIPRDTLIKIYDGAWEGYYDKIGHCLYWEGLDNLKKNVEILINSPIYKVAIIDNFKSFETFLEILGGIEIDKFLYNDTGVQWIRNRNFKYGDIDRCKRQQVFLKKSAIKIWKISNKGNYFYSSFLFDGFKKIIYTDLTKQDFLKILYLLKRKNFNPDKDFYTCVLPGEFGFYNSKLLNRNKLVCWKLDDEIIKKLQFLFYSDENNSILILKNKINYLSFLQLDCNNYFEKFKKNSIIKNF